MPSPRLGAPPHGVEASSSPSQSQATIIHASSERHLGDNVATVRMETSANRHSTRWARFLHFFQPSRRRRAALTAHTASNADSNADTRSVRGTFGLHATPSSTATPSLTHSTHTSAIGMRRANRRGRHIRTRPNSSRDRQRSRRTMSDGALRHAELENSSSSPSGHPHTSTASPSASSTTSRSGRGPISQQSVASMRYRRIAATPVDGASTASTGGGARSTTIALSDSDDSTAFEETIQALGTNSDSNAVNTSNGISESSDGRSSTMVSSTLADLDPFQDHELLAVVNRMFDDYPSASSDAYHSSVYVGRLPSQASQRLAMRVQNAYVISGRRQSRAYGGNGDMTMRIGISGLHPHHHHHHMHHHHHHGHGIPLHLYSTFGADDRELRLHMQTVRVQEGGAGGVDSVATDAQIEALPSFVMEKGETRSVQEIFANMRAGSTDKGNEEGGGSARSEGDADGRKAKDDECGGLMTSYTECAICLCDFEPGDEITSLPCGHFFHLTGCVREWLGKHARTCPTCRADISENRDTATEAG